MKIKTYICIIQNTKFSSKIFPVVLALLKTFWWKIFFDFVSFALFHFQGPQFFLQINIYTVFQTKFWNYVYNVMPLPLSNIIENFIIHRFHCNGWATVLYNSVQTLNIPLPCKNCITENFPPYLRIALTLDKD